MRKDTSFGEYVYICENKFCSEHGVEKNGARRICPICGTETIIYKIRTDVEKKLLYMLIIVSALLALCILGYVYLFSSSVECVEDRSSSRECQAKYGAGEHDHNCQIVYIAKTKDGADDEFNFVVGRLRVSAGKSVAGGDNNGYLIDGFHAGIGSGWPRL